MVHSAFRPSEEIFGIHSVDGGKRHGERQNAPGALGGNYENYLVCGLDSLRAAPLRSLSSSGSVDEAVRDVSGPRSGLFTLRLLPPRRLLQLLLLLPLPWPRMHWPMLHSSPFSLSALLPDGSRQPTARKVAGRLTRALRDSLSSPTPRSGFSGGGPSPGQGH